MKRFLVTMLTIVLALSLGTMVYAAPSSAADWDMDTDEWTAGTTGGFSLEKIGSAGDSADNIFKKSITGAFDISYDVTFAHTADIVDSHTISLRIPTSPEVKLFIRVQGCNGSAIIKGQVLVEGSWITLFGDDNWISDAGQNLSVTMSRAKGSDFMTFTVKSGSTVLRTAEVTHDKMKASNFWDFKNDEIKGLELRLGGDGGDGRFTLSGIDITIEEPEEDESKPAGGNPNTSAMLPLSMFALAGVSASAFVYLRGKKK